MTGVDDSRDPGLQPERTILAWRRTALTAVGVTVSVLKLHGGGHRWLLLAAVAALVGVIAATGAGLWLRRNRYRADPRHHHPAPSSVVVCICLGIPIAAVCCALDVLT